MVSTKNIERVVYLVGIFVTLIPGDPISGSSEKLLGGGRRGVSLLFKFATKAAGSLNVKDQVSP